MFVENVVYIWVKYRLFDVVISLYLWCSSCKVFFPGGYDGSTCSLSHCHRNVRGQRSVLCRFHCSVMCNKSALFLRHGALSVGRLIMFNDSATACVIPVFIIGLFVVWTDSLKWNQEECAEEEVMEGVFTSSGEQRWISSALMWFVMLVLMLMKGIRAGQNPTTSHSLHYKSLFLFFFFSSGFRSCSLAAICCSSSRLQLLRTNPPQLQHTVVRLL